MTTKSERLDFIRKQEGLSYKALADLIGFIGGDAMRKAITRNTVKDYYINIIAEKLNINKDWILTGNGTRELNTIDNELYLEKDGIKVSVKEIIDFFEDNYDHLLETDNFFKLYHKDKIQTGVFELMKKDGN